MFVGKLWEGLAGGLAKRWIEHLLSPAALFAAGGLLAWVWANGWDGLERNLSNLTTVRQFVFALAAIGLLLALAAVVEGLLYPALRALEGYWPGKFHPLRRILVNRRGRRLLGKRARWDNLADRFEVLTHEEREEYVRLEAEFYSNPAPCRLMPTALGNRLRAAEDYSWRRYGLAAPVVWPRLWLLLPQDTRTALEQARERLDASVRLFLWGLLFLGWSMWAWWAAPVALAAVVWGYGRAVEAAELYGELLRAAFDLHRWCLYQALRWPLPTDAKQERAHGEALTRYLWRGSDQSWPTFHERFPVKGRRITSGHLRKGWKRHS